MSTPDERASGNLTVNGPPGGVIEVVDGLREKIAVGSRQLVLQNLQEGIYTVRWLGGPAPETRRVRLFAADSTTRVSGGGVEQAASDARDLEQVQIAIDGAFGTTPIAKRRGHGTKTTAGAITVTVDSPDGNAQADAARSLRLFDIARSGKNMFEAPAETKFGERSASLQPGVYLLQYEASGKRTVEQIVEVFHGRRTLVFMIYARGYELRRRGTATALTAIRGIDPSKTLIVSTDLLDRSPRLRSHFAAAENLLGGLRGSPVGLDWRYAEQLTQARDPYTARYCAALLVRDSNRDPVDDRWGLELAADMVRSHEREGSDIAALAYRLKILNAWDGEPPARIECPPMLTLCWQWIVEWSGRSPTVIPSTPLIEAASDGGSAFTPWLVWRRSDVRRRKEVVTPDAATAGDTIRTISELVEMLRSDTPVVGSANVPAPGTLSDKSQRLIDDLAHVGLGSRDSDQLDLSEVTQRLAMPVSSIVRRADELLSELQAASRASS